MAGRKSKPLFLRDGVYYARIYGNRWSTETDDEAEALRRRSFMIARNKPWSEVKQNQGDQVIIRIDTEGRTFSEIVQHYSEPVKAFRRIKDNADLPATASQTNGVPPKTCKDIPILLDYEFLIKTSGEIPEGTRKYYEQRYDCLKRYVKEHSLDLDTFTSLKAVEYPQYRLVVTARREGEVGFNNRKASPSTINKEIKHFRNLWRTWREEGRVVENPWTRVALLKDKGTEDEIDDQPYTFEEITSILNNVQNLVIRAVLIFQAMLGTRPGEEVLRITGKSIRANKIYSLKKRRWDTFFYSQEAVNFFTQYIEGHTEGLDAAAIRDEFKKACKKAGVREGTPYDLRHWFGTESLLDNKIEVVQVMMRHLELKTTQIYAKIRNKTAEQAQHTMQRKVLSAFSTDNIEMSQSNDTNNDIESDKDK